MNDELDEYMAKVSEIAKREGAREALEEGKNKIDAARKYAEPKSGQHQGLGQAFILLHDLLTHYNLDVLDVDSENNALREVDNGN